MNQDLSVHPAFSMSSHQTIDEENEEDAIGIKYS